MSMEKPMVWPEASFRIRAGVATPLLKFTVSAWDAEVNVVPSKEPQLPSGAWLTPEIVTLLLPLKAVSVAPSESFTVRVMVLLAPATGVPVAAAAIAV